jgi:cytosine deaminase
MPPTRFADIAWPDARRYWIVNARVPACLLADASAFAARDDEDLVRADLLIEDGKFARIEPASSAREGIAVDIGGRQLWPTLIDIHTHLDKGHTVERSPNPDGTFLNARLSTAADRPNWTMPDLNRRMRFGLRCAEAHGVSAIRSHIDTYPETIERSWPVVRELREEWAGRIALQAVSLCPIDLLMDDYGDQVARTVKQSHGLLGGVTRPAEGDHAATPANIGEQLDRLFALAARNDLDIDLHVDETNDPLAATLPHIAQAALRHGYKGRVTCGHCCSLALQSESDVDRTLDLLAEAEIAIVTLPTVNLYLQDRANGRTPRWRGVTVVHEMLKRGIPVAAAGDNCRDSFYAYGDHDVLDTFRQAVRILHLDHPLTVAPSLVGSTPAEMAGLDDHGRFAVGAPAHFIVFNARSLNEIISRHHADRVVFRNGVRLNAQVPDYDELLEDDASAGAARVA